MNANSDPVLHLQQNQKLRPPARTYARERTYAPVRFQNSVLAELGPKSLSNGYQILWLIICCSDAHVELGRFAKNNNDEAACVSFSGLRINLITTGYYYRCSHENAAQYANRILSGWWAEPELFARSNDRQTRRQAASHTQ